MIGTDWPTRDLRPGVQKDIFKEETFERDLDSKKEPTKEQGIETSTE